MRTWYSIKAQDGSSSAEFSIHGPIGEWDVSPSACVREIRGIKASEIKVFINSPGGDVDGSIAIVNALREHPARIVAKIDAVAHSMASVIAVSADHVIAPKNTMMMIHNPWTVSIGGPAEMRATADLLEKVAGLMLDEYVRRAGEEKRDEIKAAMNAETWYTAEEAKAMGFVDEVVDPVPLRAMWSKEPLKASAPAAFFAELEEIEPEDLADEDPETEEIEAAPGAAEVEPVAEPTAEGGVIDAHAEIRALCRAFNVEARADAFIAARTPIEDIRKDLIRALAEEDQKTVIDNQIEPVVALPEQAPQSPAARLEKIARARFERFNKSNAGRNKTS